MQFLLKSASLKLSIREKCYFYIQIDSELKDMENSDFLSIPTHCKYIDR